MLGIDYSTQLRKVIESIQWNIELPMEWADYFEQRGENAAFPDDKRSNQRLTIRTCGVMWFDQTLPFRARTKNPIGIYTRDFSRKGAGFLSPIQLYPEERVRVILPTFWVQLKVARGRRITHKCFEVGTVLQTRHDPSPLAFDVADPTTAFA